MLTSRDRAGNLSQNTMDGKNATRDGAFEVKFAVDTTAPVAGLAGIGSRGVYLDPQKQVHVDAHDNVELASVALTVDAVSYTHLDVYKRQASEFVTARLGKKEGE